MACPVAGLGVACCFVQRTASRRAARRATTATHAGGRLQRDLQSRHRRFAVSTTTNCSSSRSVRPHVRLRVLPSRRASTERATRDTMSQSTVLPTFGLRSLETACPAAPAPGLRRRHHLSGSLRRRHTVGGDGCSADCKTLIPALHLQTTSAALLPTLTIPILYRDFLYKGRSTARKNYTGIPVRKRHPPARRAREDLLD